MPMYKLTELRSMARSQKISGRSKMNKAALLSALGLKEECPPGKRMNTTTMKCIKQSIVLVPSVFNPATGSGDFSRMITQKQYQDVLFIFNDNETDFKNQSCHAGGGNAAIRPYQCSQIPRCTGIATGPGYKKLTLENKKVIDAGIAKIYILLKSGRYKRVFYSAEKNGSLGSSIFAVGIDVKNYIVSQLNKVCNSI